MRTLIVWLVLFSMVTPAFAWGHRTGYSNKSGISRNFWPKVSKIHYNQ